MIEFIEVKYRGDDWLVHCCVMEIDVVESPDMLQTKYILKEEPEDHINTYQGCYTY